MDGYDDSTYGDAFADVYDDWYADISDVDQTVDTLLELAAGASVLELGVGTGRLAVPLARAGKAAGVAVTGLDTSATMLDRLAQRDPDGIVVPVVGNMADELPGGPYGLVFSAYNTIFNLRSRESQAACFAAVSSALAPGGRFVVEAFVPVEHADRGGNVTVRSIATDRVVLSVSVQRAPEQVAEGQFIEITEAGGIRLRPWSIRYADPTELDAMAAAAGLTVEHRWAGFDRHPFDSTSDRHVTVYRTP